MGTWFLFWDDENTLKLDTVDGIMTVNILKPTELYTLKVEFNGI